MVNGAENVIRLIQQKTLRRESAAADGAGSLRGQFPGRGAAHTARIFRLVLLEGLADIWNDVDQAEPLRELVNGCGIERSAGDKGHLVAGDSSNVHCAEEEAAAVEHNAAKTIVRPGGIVDRVIRVMLRQFPAVVDEEKMTMVGLSGQPRIDHETARDAVIGGFVVGQLNRVRGGRAGNGMSHVDGEGLILRA